MPMISIVVKEIHAFFSSIIAYVAISVFIVFMGLFVWVFSDSSLLEGNYVSLDALFSIAPAVLIFLVPSITMKSFAEEYQTGTIEILGTKPLTDLQILLGKFMANAVIVLLAILSTVIYYWSIYRLSSPVGNVDTGAIVGSYFGLILLSLSMVSIGLFASLLSGNQIVAFLIGSLLCFLMHFAFEFISGLPAFFGTIDHVVEYLGMNAHYSSMSRGLIQSNDVIYFISIIFFFVMLALETMKWQRN